ncbi:hypothetical protein [Bacteroides sedimenti]|uniref:Uncharacterized protein n=1 Tax=Bacteroides sedimenti TaxID=2136147 RepID=A0ABM8ICA5_9BACE
MKEQGSKQGDLLMIKKDIFFLLVVFLLGINCQSIAQKKYNPFHRVEVPDSISLKLENAYKLITDCDSVNAGRNVWNIVDRKDLVFKDGLYSFQGQGPHFPRCIFIYKDNKIFIFKSVGAFDPVGVLKEYIECIEYLKLSEKEQIKYLKYIASYLENESGLTYGREIIKME